MTAEEPPGSNQICCPGLRGGKARDAFRYLRSANSSVSADKGGESTWNAPSIEVGWRALPKVKVLTPKDLALGLTLLVRAMLNEYLYGGRAASFCVPNRGSTSSKDIAWQPFRGPVFLGPTGSSQLLIGSTSSRSRVSLTPTFRKPVIVELLSENFSDAENHNAGLVADWRTLCHIYATLITLKLCHKEPLKPCDRTDLLAHARSRRGVTASGIERLPYRTESELQARMRVERRSLKRATHSERVRRKAAA